MVHLLFQFIKMRDWHWYLWKFQTLLEMELCFGIWRMGGIPLFLTSIAWCRWLLEMYHQTLTNQLASSLNIFSWSIIPNIIWLIRSRSFTINCTNATDLLAKCAYINIKKCAYLFDMDLRNLETTTNKHMMKYLTSLLSPSSKKIVSEILVGIMIYVLLHLLKLFLRLCRLFMMQINLLSWLRRRKKCRIGWISTSLNILETNLWGQP